MLGRLLRRFRHKPSRRHENPYATHVPVLIGQARLRTHRHVLELGSGKYSTPLFLDRRVFPDLVSLHSVDNDAAWYEEVRGQFGHDARAEFTFASGSMADFASQFDFSKYTLIFVDDSLSAAQRAETIKAVARRASPDSFVLIHDFEVPEYQEAARAFPHVYSFNAFEPHTALAWFESAHPADALARIQKLVRRHTNLPPDDVPAWLKVFDRQP